MKRMPALFIGHGSPMLALDHNKTVRTNLFQNIDPFSIKMLTELGHQVLEGFLRTVSIIIEGILIDTDAIR